MEDYWGDHLEWTKQNWVFISCSEVPKRCNDLAMEDEVVSETKKQVRDFLTNIRDDRLGAANTFIYGNPKHKGSSTACPQYLQGLMTSVKYAESLSQGARRGRNVSFAIREGQGPKFTGKLKANDRYPNNVFRQFTPVQKEELKKLQEDVAKKNGRMTKAHQRKAVAVAAKKQGRSDEESEEDTPSTQSGNKFEFVAHSNAKKAKQWPSSGSQIEM
eukprot:jgi/Psemu1/18111/gm1.18111_g